MSWVTQVKERLKSYPSFPKERLVAKIVAKQTVDSITSCAFLLKYFQAQDYSFSCSFQKEIDESIENSHEDLIVIINKGIKIIERARDGKKEFSIPENEFGPRIPTTAIVYLLCKPSFSKSQELSHLVPIPFIGGEIDIPEDLLKELQCIESKPSYIISSTLPLHKALANTLCPYISQVSGNEEKVINFLIENEISIRENSKFKSLEDLNEESKTKLLSAIALKRIGTSRLIQNTYINTKEDDSSITKDLKFFSYLIKSCIAYDKPSLALNICMNSALKNKANEFIASSQISIIKAMEFYLQNRRSLTIDKEHLSIIKLESEIDERLIDLFLELTSESNFLQGKTLGLSFFNAHGNLSLKFYTKTQSGEENASQITNRLKELMEFSLERGIITVPMDQSDKLYEKLITASESINPTLLEIEPIIVKP